MKSGFESARSGSIRRVEDEAQPSVVIGLHASGAIVEGAGGRSCGHAISDGLRFFTLDGNRFYVRVDRLYRGERSIAAIATCSDHLVDPKK